jgi:hypothetical protein
VPKETDLLIEVFLKLPLDIEVDENNVLADSACIQPKALDQLNQPRVWWIAPRHMRSIICIRKEGWSEIGYAMDA